MGLHRGYDNRNSRERNKNEIVLTKILSLTGAPIDQNALRFSQMQYGNQVSSGFSKKKFDSEMHTEGK